MCTQKNAAYSCVCDQGDSGARVSNTGKKESSDRVRVTEYYETRATNCLVEITFKSN